MLDHMSIQCRDFWIGAQQTGAFVRDPDDNNIEAVCHLPE